MIECTSLLAKLLAEENIAIMHDSTLSSAKFDLVKRVLALPVYNDMSGDNFDGMMSTEVAHALWTPVTQYNAVVKRLTSLNPEYEQIIKMIEGVRVEKHLKRKYPGLSGTLSKMYLDFWDKNYFGISHMPLENLNIVDKLNIGSKVPWFDIPMDSYEETFKQDLNRVETFQDACVLARDIIDYLKQKQEEYEKSLTENQGDENDENDGESEDMAESDPSGESTNGDDESDSDGDDETDECSTDSDDDMVSDSDDDSDDSADDSDTGDDDQSESDQSDDGDDGAESTDDSESDGNDASCEDGDDCESDEECECSGRGGDSESSDGESGDDDADDGSVQDGSEEDEGSEGSESDDNESGEGDSEGEGSESDSDSVSDDECGSDGESDDGEGESDDGDCGSDVSDGNGANDGEQDDDCEGDDSDCEPSEGDTTDVASSNVAAPQPIQSIENYEQSIRENEVNQNAEELLNFSIPEISNYKDMIDTPETVHRSWNRRISRDEPLTIKRINKAWLDFKSNERKTVDLMKQLFEMRRNAAELRRTRSAKTGKLDLKKLAFYKVTEDIFKSTTLVDDGTNHGIALILDFSGSMSGARMYQTMRQTLIMIMFAQAVKIPFVVWGYTNPSTENYAGGTSDPSLQKKKYEYDSTCPLSRPQLGACALREVINSDLPTITQRQIMRNMFREAIAHYGSKFHGLRSLNQCEHLGGTPTNEAMAIASLAIRDWKRDHSVEVMNTLVITDGDSSPLTLPRDGNKSSGNITKNFMAHDEISHKSYNSDEYRGFKGEELGKIVNKIMYDVVRNRSESTLMVMHIGSLTNVRRQVQRYFKDTEWEESIKSLETRNCCVKMDYLGTDRLILSVDRDVVCEMKLDTSGSMKKLESDFMDQSRKVLQNKVVADIMLDVISKKL